MQKERAYPRVSVVIPVLNEAENLYYVLPFLPSIVDEVVLVDGHSKDATIEIAQQLCPQIKVVAQSRRGKGNALKEGFAASTGDIIVMIDGDSSTNPAEIPHFVEALLRGNDFAKGSRFVKGGGSEDITPVRSLGNYALSTLVNLLFNTRYSDLCYGYNAFWRHALDRIELECDGFEVETMLNLRAYKAGLKIVEVPSYERVRIFGVSNLRVIRDGWRVLKTILKERFRTTETLQPIEKVTDDVPPYVLSGR